MLITDYHMRDAAFLDKVDSTELHDCDVWAGYIGGAAQNTWSDNDWRRVEQFPKLPIYVTRPDKTGMYCGLEAIMGIYKLGIPHGTAIAADLELLSDKVADMAEWLTDFDKVLTFFGYETWKYGSTDYLFDIPGVAGSWVATDSKIPEQYKKPGVHSTQYLFGNPFDASLIHRHAVHTRLAVKWGLYS